MSEILKFGDLVRNEWAGDKNPQRILMFRTQTRNKVKCLSLCGQSVDFYNDAQLRLTKIGSLDLSEWHRELHREPIVDEYRVDCKGTECGWAGLSTECFKVTDDIFCPDCGMAVEPVHE